MKESQQELVTILNQIESLKDNLIFYENITKDQIIDALNRALKNIYKLNEKMKTKLK